MGLLSDGWSLTPELVFSTVHPWVPWTECCTFFGGSIVHVYSKFLAAWRFHPHRKDMHNYSSHSALPWWQIPKLDGWRCPLLVEWFCFWCRNGCFLFKPLLPSTLSQIIDTLFLCSIQHSSWLLPWMMTTSGPPLSVLLLILGCLPLSFAYTSCFSFPLRMLLMLLMLLLPEHFYSLCSGLQSLLKILQAFGFVASPDLFAACSHWPSPFPVSFLRCFFVSISGIFWYIPRPISNVASFFLSLWDGCRHLMIRNLTGCGL